MRPECIGGQLNGRNTPYSHHRINKFADDDDDGYNGSSDNADDDEEDIKTLHISATSTRLERRQNSDRGSNIFKTGVR